MARTEAYFREAYRYPKLYDPDHPQIDRIGMQGDALNVAVATDNERIDEDIALFRDALMQDDELLSERLRILARVLKEAGY